MVTPRTAQAGGIILRDWIGWILVAGIAGGMGFGGSALKDQVIPPRPDPFTGTDGRQMEQRLAEADRRLWEAIRTLDSDGSRGVQALTQRMSGIESSMNAQNTKLEATLAIVTELRLSLARWESRYTER
jgi:hypothetical protein